MLPRPILVVGVSMEPTLTPGDCVLVAHRPEPAVAEGDIVLVALPDPCERRLSLKRVVCAPNRWFDFTASPARWPYFEPYGHERYRTRDDEVLVLGDNPLHSTDSRTLGPVKTRQVRGRVVSRLRPVNRITRWAEAKLR